MKIEVNIDKKILLVVLGIFLIGTGVYAAVNTSLPYHDASQTRLSSGDSVQDYINKMSTFAPGNVTIAHSIFESSFDGTTYKKVKEIQVAQGGIVNVSFGLSECSLGDGVAKIYVNGVARGTERKSSSSSLRYFSEDIAVNSSDKIQLYVKCSLTGYNGKVADFKIQVANTLQVAVVTYEDSSSWK